MLENGKATSIKQIFQSMIPESSTVLEGTVVKTSPLNIKLANDSKMILSSNSLVVPKHLTDYQLEVDFKKSEGTNEHGTVLIHNALKKDEQVLLMQFDNAKRYFVLDRKG